MIDWGWQWAQVAQAALLLRYIEYEAIHEQEVREWFPAGPPVAADGWPIFGDYIDAVGFVRDMVFQEEWRFAAQHDPATVRDMAARDRMILEAMAAHQEAAVVAALPPHWRMLRFADEDPEA